MIESAHPFDPVALKRLYTRIYGIFEILPIGKEAESGEKEEEEDETRGGTAEPRPIYTLAESGV